MAWKKCQFAIMNEAIKVVERLRALHKTVVSAESCTGGLLGSLLTDISGSSAVYLGGIISYTCPVKEEFLGVSHHSLETMGAVSQCVAEEMAVGARLRLHGDYGVGITGLAGPDGDGSENPLGTVYVAISDAQRVACTRLQLKGSRVEIKQEACRNALQLLLNTLS